MDGWFRFICSEQRLTLDMVPDSTILLDDCVHRCPCVQQVVLWFQGLSCSWMSALMDCCALLCQRYGCAAPIFFFLFIFFFKGALQLDSETIGEFWKDGKVMGMENNSLERRGWWKTEADTGWKQAQGKQRAESWEMKHSNHSYRSPPPFHWFIPHRSSIVTQAGRTKKSPCDLSAQEEFKQTRAPWC